VVSRARFQPLLRMAQIWMFRGKMALLKAQPICTSHWVNLSEIIKHVLNSVMIPMKFSRAHHSADHKCPLPRNIQIFATNAIWSSGIITLVPYTRGVALKLW
jgi:hypothetical protein